METALLKPQLTTIGFITFWDSNGEKCIFKKFKPVRFYSVSKEVLVESKKVLVWENSLAILNMVLILWELYFTNF